MEKGDGGFSRRAVQERESAQETRNAVRHEAEPSPVCSALRQGAGTADLPQPSAASFCKSRPSWRVSAQAS